jgi:exonuclease III
LHAPRRKSFLGVAMAMRTRLPCSSTAKHTTAMTTTSAYRCVVASFNFVGWRSTTPSSVAMLQLLCFSDLLMS